MLWGDSSTKYDPSRKRALPVGVTEFHEWSDQIILGACLMATAESQKFALANMLLSLPATTAHESDAYFIACLRKTAVNQVAEFIREDTRSKAKARLAAAEELKQKEAAATAQLSADEPKVLENQPI